MADIDPYAMDMLVGVASNALTEAGKAVAERLFDRHDPFATLWTEAVDRLEAEEHELRQLHAADVRKAFAAGMIRNTAGLSLLIQDKTGIIRERADQLAPHLADTLSAACRDLAVQAAKGSEQAHRVIDQIDHVETKNLLQHLLGIVLDLAERSQPSPAPVEHTIPRMAPSPPANYVDRPRETSAVLAALLADREGRTVGITTALRGAGGFGKTTLAQHICGLDAVKAHFPDGILWVTLGENPGDLTGKVNGLLHGLDYTGPDFTDLDQAAGHLATLLGDRRMLMVIDDAWSSAHVAPFMRGGKRCVRLITTRQGAVLPPGTVDVFADAMQPSEAVDLLGSGLRVADGCDLGPLAARLGEWPLLLNIVNGVLRKRIGLGDDLPDALLCVDLALDVHGLTAFDPDDPAARNQAVAATVRVSLQMLHKQPRERYLELAIFPEDTDVPLSAIARLWGATGGMDEGAVEGLCILLKDASLLLKLDLAEKTLRLHDVMRDLLMDEVGAARLAELHSTFLDAYGVEHWADLPPDEQHLWHHLAHHLLGAGREDELRALLLDYRWLAAKLSATDLVALIADYAPFPDDHELRLVQGALHLAGQIVATDPRQLPSQLWGRLGADDGPAIADLLGQARDAPDYPWLRPVRPTLERPGAALARILRGDSANAASVSLSSDGRRAAAGGADGMVRVWDLASGAELHHMEGHTRIVRAICISDNGDLALSGGDDGTVRVWDLETGAQRHCLAGHHGPVFSVSLSPGGHSGASAGGDGTIRVWDLDRGLQLRALDGDTDPIQCFRLALADRVAVSGGRGGMLRVWDLESGAESLRLEGHRGPVLAVSMSSDGRVAVSGGADGTVRMWDLESGSECLVLEGHSGLVSAVSVRPDGRVAVSGGSDCTVRVWDAGSGSECHRFMGHSHISAVSLSPDGSTVLCAGSDGAVRVWDLAAATGPDPPCGHTGAVRGVSTSADGRRAVSCGSDATIRVWDVATGSEVHRFEGHSGPARAVSMSADARLAVSGGDDGAVCVWDLERRLQTCRLAEHIGRVRAVSVSSDGCRAVVAGAAGAVRALDLGTGLASCLLDGYTDRVSAVCVSPDANRLVSGDERQIEVRVWDLDHGVERPPLVGHTDPLCAICVSADGRRVVSGAYDHTLRSWDLVSGEELHRLDGHVGVVRAVGLTPDGAYAASCGDDGTVRLWDMGSAAEVARLCGVGWVCACGIAPDGRTIVAGDASGRVHFLRLENADASPE